MSITNIFRNCPLKKKLYAVEFTAIDEDTALPIAGAVCSIGSLSAITGADGKAVISSLRAGTYQYLITADGYDDFSGSFSAPEV